MPVTAAPVPSPTSQSLRFRGRSFLALVLAPEPPLSGWLESLDAWNKRSPGFFRGRPVVLDVSALDLDKEGIAKIVADLAERDVRLMGIEGTKASWLGLGMPPLVSGGRDAEVSELAALPARESGKSEEVAVAIPAQAPGKALVVGHPIRSGQSIVHPQGDVTIVGSVASGAEVIAGGSIHVYGALRGRAIAGAAGDAEARIFCGKLEAELIAIDGLYRTADDMEAEYRGKPMQAWLEGDAIRMSALS